MKKIGIMIFLLAMLIIAFCSVKINQSYSTLPTIYYDGQTKEATSFNASDDLFDDFKNVMPGDVRKEEILFKVDNIKDNTKVFLNIKESNKESLSENIRIKLYIDDEELKSSNENVEIGSFSKDGQVKLTIVLELSEDTGNEVENLNYKIDWKILIQEGDEDLIEVPYTYDNSNVLLYIIIFIVSVICMIYALYVLSRKD